MQKRVIALGCFDGVHLGHSALLAAVCEQAQRLAATAAAITFDAHPLSVLTGTAVSMLTDTEERKRLMRLRGIAEVLVLHFDESLRKMPWQTFAEDLLIGQYGAAALVCGEDFRFGAGGEGTAQRLAEFCRTRSLGCTIVPKVCAEGETVSSTRIRALIAQGEVEKAAKMLGHPFTQRGIVCRGNQIGATIGAPTANVPFGTAMVIPACGVYAAEVTVRDRRYAALVNVGVHPTVRELKSPIAEAWLQDFDGDLYGEELRIDYLRRIRGERKFDSLEDLKAQLAADRAAL